MKPVVWLGFLTMASPLAAADREVDYQRDVKPILRERCYACHGAVKQEAGLRLDTGALIRKGGDRGPAAVAGKAEASRIVRRISSNDPDERMPPEASPLTAEQISIIRRWIAQGAHSPVDERPETDPRSHWAFQVPRRPALPRFDDAQTKAWVRNPIDAFIAAEHRRRGLTPVPPADRATLLRRLYLDLIGMPPTRQELDEFLRDDSRNAYEKVVDRLLASPRYGERWGRHWMDIWRYSDWYGRRAANDVRNSSRQIWRWRDWIIRSLNLDKPYDRMIVEMLAGDEIAPRDPDVVVATGFIVRNCYRVNFHTWKQDMVEHTGKAFLGLTLNCALCHDHKYDPITHEDYFRFRAFFEPLRLRHDRMPGEPDPGPYVEYDFHGNGHRPVKGGLARVYDGSLSLTTPMYRLGDARDLLKDKPPVTAGVPTFFRREPLQIEPVDLPAVAWYPGLKPFIQQEELAKRGDDVRAAETALQKSQRRLAELADKAKVAEAALAKAQQERAAANARKAKPPSTEERVAVADRLAASLSQRTIGHWRFEGGDAADGFLADSSGHGHSLSRVTSGGAPVAREPLIVKRAARDARVAGAAFPPLPRDGLSNRQAARFQQRGRVAYVAARGAADLHASQFTLQVLLNHSAARRGVNCTIADYEGSWWFYHRGLNSQESELRLVLWNPDRDYLDVVTGRGPNKIALKTNTDYCVAVVVGKRDVSFHVRDLSAAGPLQTATFDRRRGVRRGGGMADLTKLRKPDPKTPLRIGNSVGGGERHQGLLDEIRYLRGALTAEEIARLAGAPREESALRRAEASLRQIRAQRAETESAIRMGRAKLARAQAEAEALQARVAADNARYKATHANGNARNRVTATAVRVLARAAAKAERRAAVAQAKLELVQAERDAQAARQKGDAKKAEQQLDAARGKLETANRSLRALAKSAVAKHTPLSEQFPKQSSGGRTALARWIASPQNPLTARVAVNHIWARHFGQPLVETVYDFGLNGKRPTHPRLLDWLAVDLMENGWTTKRLHRLIVTSRTYRMSSADRRPPGPRSDNPRSENPRRDNRALARFPRRRMEAEVVRDSLLHLAGSLDLSQGGPDIDTKRGASVNRRSLYFTVHPEGGMMRFMTVFNPPDPCDCYRRAESVVPQQALALTNSRLAVKQSRLLARRLWSEIQVEAATSADLTAAFIQAAFTHLLTRQPTKQEQRACQEFLNEQIELFRRTAPGRLQTKAAKDGVAPSNDPRLRALESLVGALLSHNDFVTIR